MAAAGRGRVGTAPGQGGETDVVREVRPQPPRAPPRRAPPPRRVEGPVELRPRDLALPPRAPDPPLVALALLAAALALALVEWLAYRQAGGVFEYPLDDPYIHMAMADQILRGGYGVNPGEYASAASSILYPVLLAPLMATEAARFAPLVLNALALLFAARLWGRLLVEAGYGAAGLRTTGYVLALFGPVAFNMTGVAFLGMEHTLHVALVLALVLGLMRVLDGKGPGTLLVLGIVAAPLVRFEALGLSGLACLVLMARGRVFGGLLLGLLAVLPVAGFAWWLTTLGLDPVPNSVRAKLALANLERVAAHVRILAVFLYNVKTPVGMALLALAVFWAVAGVLHPLVRRNARFPLVALLVFGTLGHLAFGQIGWFHRYEIYVVVLLAAGSAVLAAPLMHRDRRGSALARVAAVAGLALAGSYYPRDVFLVGPQASAAIHLQQAQMARIAREVVQGPVAVNDLGRVVWRNPHYVLDLWGLASAEALRLRFADPAPGWAAPLVAARGVRLVMIYESWLGRAVGPDWVRVGTLVLTAPRGFVASTEVAFYAPDPAEAPDLRERLAAFAATLPPGAEFRPAP